MGLSQQAIEHGLTVLAARDARIAQWVGRHGLPEPRIRPRGYETLLRTIVSQQISTLAADSIWRKLEATLGDIASADHLLAASDEALQAAGLSRSKRVYARSLADAVASGRLDLQGLAPEDEQAIEQLTTIKGIGRWSAEIYLLFAEGRPDIWPAGDLAIQIAIGELMAATDRPSERAVRAEAEAWRPHRGAMALLAWHNYALLSQPARK